METPRNNFRNKPLMIGCGSVAVFGLLVVLLIAFAPEPKDTAGYTEDQRKAIYVELMAADQKAQAEADAKYPITLASDDRRTVQKNNDLTAQLSAKYRSAIRKKYKIDAAYVAKLPKEALDKQWTAPAPPQPRSVGIGEIGCVRCESDPAVLLAIDKESHEALIKAAVASDNEGIAELMLAGKLISVGRDTKVKVIDRATFARRVRVLDGEMAGKAGWISSEFVVPAETAQ